jgi:hypothetical protein
MLNEQNDFDEREILPENIYVHPKYKKERADNRPNHLYDIALVKLDRKIDLKPELLPVCLWDETIKSMHSFKLVPCGGCKKYPCTFNQRCYIFDP